MEHGVEAARPAADAAARCSALGGARRIFLKLFRYCGASFSVAAVCFLFHMRLGGSMLKHNSEDTVEIPIPH